MGKKSKSLELENQYPKAASLTANISVLVLITAPVLYLGLSMMDNYRRWLLFSLVLLLAGIAGALVIFAVVRRFLPGAQEYKNEKGINLRSAFIALGSIWFLGLGPAVNQSVDLSTDCRNYLIEHVYKASSKRQSNHVFILTEHGSERLDCTNKFCETHKAGDSALVCHHTGIFGFDYYRVTRK